MIDQSELCEFGNTKLCQRFFKLRDCSQLGGIRTHVLIDHKLSDYRLSQCNIQISGRVDVQASDNKLLYVE